MWQQQITNTRDHDAVKGREEEEEEEVREEEMEEGLLSADRKLPAARQNRKSPPFPYTLRHGGPFRLSARFFVCLFVRLLFVSLSIRLLSSFVFFSLRY